MERDAPMLRNKIVYSPIIQVLTSCAKDDEHRPHIIANLSVTKVIDNMNNHHVNDVDIAASVTSLLTALCKDSEGCLAAERNQAVPITDTLTEIMKRHGNVARVAVPAMTALGYYSAHSTKNNRHLMDPMPDTPDIDSALKGPAWKMATRTALGAADMDADGGVDRMIAYNDMMALALSNPDLVPYVDAEDPLSKALRMSAATDDAEATVKLQTSVVALMAAHTNASLASTVNVEAASQFAMDVVNSPEMPMDLRVAASTAAIGMMVAASMPPSPEALESFSAIANETQNAALLSKLEELNVTGAEHAVEESAEIGTEAFDGDAFDINPEDPEALTLKQINYWLVNDKIANELTIDIATEEDADVYARFEYNHTKLTEYDANRLKVTDFGGFDTVWGCKNWTIWLEQTPDVLYTMLDAEWGCHNMLLEIIRCQVPNTPEKQERGKAVAIATAASTTLVKMTSVEDPGAYTLAEIESICTDLTYNLNCALEDDATKTLEAHVIPRLNLIENIAVNRKIMTDPKLIGCISRIWDSYDSGIYSAECMRHAFRALRRTFCAEHSAKVKELGMLERLLKLLKDRDQADLLLVDGYFLLGVIAIDQKLKGLIGDLNGVEDTLSSVEHYMQKNSSGVVTNACLALANIVLGNRKNGNRFYKSGGMQLNVRIMKDRASHHDEVNAAAALLTNCCFMRDDFKAAYGTEQIGAPKGLSFAIGNYDGADSVQAARALRNLFKAISNLALHSPNVALFLESGLEQSYVQLLGVCENLPDSVLLMAMTTLSNLCWENQLDNMERFGVTIPAIIGMLNQESRTDPELMGSALEILGYLCRLPANALAFDEYGGSQAVVNTLANFAALSTEFLMQATLCLTILTRREELVVSLYNADIHPYIVKVIEGEYTSETASMSQMSEVGINCFRVLTKILGYGEPEISTYFVSCGGLTTLVWYLGAMAETEEPSPVVFTEGLKVILSLLDPLTATADESRLDIKLQETTNEPKQKRTTIFGRRKASDTPEEELPELVDVSAEGTRAWQVVGLDSTAVWTLCTAITSCVGKCMLTKGDPLLLYAAAVVAYLAHEAVEGFEAAAFGVGLDSLIVTLLNNSIGRSDILTMVTGIINSLGYHYGASLAENWNKDSTCFHAYKAAVKRYGAQDKESKNEVVDRYDYTISAWEALFDGALGSIAFRRLATYNFDFEITGWKVELYPNGVQDLKNKSALREGGRIKIIEDEKNRSSFFWSANQTLSMFRWRVEKDKDNEDAHVTGEIEYTNFVPVSKLQAIVPGLSNNMLKLAAKKQKGLSQDLCMSIQGPPTEDFPQGINLSLKAKSKAERDEFVTAVSNWREAARFS
eukprot:Lankesteria_metandrocarpae@DN1476_c0_g1_i1.p1